MKQLFAFLCIASIVIAEEDHTQRSYWDYHPLHSETDAVFVMPAPISQSPEKGTIRLSLGGTGLKLMVPIDHKTQFFPAISWRTFACFWNNNPDFKERRFTYGKASLYAYTRSIENWKWLMGGSYNFNTKHPWNFSQYGYFGWLLWGTHAINSQWDFHLGVLSYLGLAKSTTVYPLIGLSYTANPQWSFRAIFPLDYAVEYHFAENWYAKLQARSFNERFRVEDYEPQPSSIFQYSATGAELNFQYKLERRVDAQLFVGYSMGGTFYIKDRTATTTMYTGFSPAPYFGAKIDFGF